MHFLYNIYFFITDEGDKRNFINAYYNNLYNTFKENIEFKEPRYYVFMNMSNFGHVNLLVTYNKNIYSLDVVPGCEKFDYRDGRGRNELLDSYLWLTLCNIQIQYNKYPDSCLSELIELTKNLQQAKTGTTSFFRYAYNRIQEEKQETFKNIYYNVGEIYTDDETCIQQTKKLIENMKEFYKTNQNDFETYLQKGLKVYGSNKEIDYEDIEANTNPFMAEVSEFIKRHQDTNNFLEYQAKKLGKAYDNISQKENLVEK